MNPTVTLTLILLFLMVVSGAVSAAAGFHVGRQALKGITQPDTRPINSMTDPEGKALRRENLTFLKEKDILASVKARIDGGDEADEAASTDKVSDKATKAGNSPSAQDKTNETAASPNPATGLPVKTEDRSVSLSVVAVKQQKDAMVFNVSLRNAGTESVQFLYSALSVTNDQGRLLSADVQGLPEEVPANGEAFSGTITIPMDLLDGATSIALSLTDYPEQQVQLQLSGIPVKR